MARRSVRGNPGRGFGFARPFVSDRMSERFRFSSIQYGPWVVFASITHVFDPSLPPVSPAPAVPVPASAPLTSVPLPLVSLPPTMPPAQPAAKAAPAAAPRSLKASRRESSRGRVLPSA
ncbi:MAG: hypothetical protein A2V77_24825 [Anaeromyxobacter sp. RBG_16_69_14]|nr:MAG: hypothetical protein A2V77_24825 [Anaeromyxobacter sp. RBG_16_69_14]